MARASWRTIKAGDLLSIPVDEQRIAIGHVVDPGQVFYLCVYLPLFAADQPIPDLHGTEIALVGRTSDELVWHGRWKIIGRQQVPADVPRPPHVVGTAQGLRLRTFAGEDMGPASEDDLAVHGYESSVSNIKFAKVMRHIHGIEPYPDDWSGISYRLAGERAARV
jgi:hypothetical protein